MPFGIPRFRMKGGAGGHKGLESIIYFLETEEFPRVRIGIDKKENISLRDYVLSQLNQKEIEFLQETLFPFLKKGIEIYKEKGYAISANYINSPEFKNRI